MRRLIHIAVAMVAVALVLAVPAGADEYAITSFTGGLTGADGSRDLQAGGHPDLAMDFTVTKRVDGAGNMFAQENLKDVKVTLPPGLLGNPTAVPTCAAEALTRPTYPRGDCPPNAQVGSVAVTAQFGLPFDIRDQEAIYNIEPPPGVTARFGFVILANVVYLDAKVTPSGGYRIVVSSPNTSQGLALTGVSTRMWGVPGSAAHDLDRMPCLSVNADVPNTTPCPAGVGMKPFLRLPTHCTGTPLDLQLAITSWQQPLRTLTAALDHGTDGEPLTVVGCDGVPFEPDLKLTPTATTPDTPTGLDATLTVPQSEDGGGIATSDMKDVSVTLPPGMTINPGSASGLTACTDEQFALHGDDPARCAESSKVGTVTARTPLLAQPLTGGVYVLTQKSSDPESGDLFRLGVTLANEERGVVVKLLGRLRVDAKTGQITTTFVDNPELPVTSFTLSFKSGPRAPLVTPAACGTQTSTATVSAWSGAEARLADAFDVGCAPGLGGFAPTVSVGTASSVAGSASPLRLAIAKPDGNTDVTGLTLALPPGLLAKVKGNLGTQIGTVKAFAGPGANPYVLPGKVFLEGRYGDAPFSLRTEVPAQAGPFDLGVVVVRQKVYVDPIDAHMTVVSDPLPTIVAGVPIRLQRLEISVDKPGFVVNPTSCAAKQVGGALTSATGQTSGIDVRFQVGDCGRLKLKPSLAMSLSGKGQTRDGDHPAIAATLTQPSGQANLKRVQVTLPLSLALDPEQAKSDDLCSFAEGSKAVPSCPASSVVGRATAVTPILDEPLSGPVYFVKNERVDPKTGRSKATLPKLVIPLVGQNGVRLTLRASSAVPDNEHLVTTFDAIPDAAVSSFKLDINGGKKGILVITGEKTDICAASQVAQQEIDGQNNATADADVYLQTPSCPLKVLSKTIGRTAVAVKVGGLGAGTVTVTGKGIHKTTKRITRSTVATISARRARGAVGKVTVSFDPTGPAKARKASK